MENHRGKSRGLGDDIKKITSATKLDQLTEKIFDLLNMDCNCDNRQEWLNKKVPYNRNNK